MISKYYENPTVFVLSSYHLIIDFYEYRKVIKLTEQEFEKNNIVTLGIKPSYLETVYRYIEVSDSLLNVSTKLLGF